MSVSYLYISLYENKIRIASLPRRKIIESHTESIVCDGSCGWICRGMTVLRMVSVISEVIVIIIITIVVFVDIIVIIIVVIVVVVNVIVIIIIIILRPPSYSSSSLR